MSQHKTHYDTLSITKDAPLSVIRAAYKALSQRYHPDKNKNDPEAGRRMAEINTAYTVLSDPRKREAYDKDVFSASGFTIEEVAPKNYDRARDAVYASTPFQSAPPKPHEKKRSISKRKLVFLYFILGVAASIWLLNAKIIGERSAFELFATRFLNSAPSQEIVGALSWSSTSPGSGGKITVKIPSDLSSITLVTASAKNTPTKDPSAAQKLGTQQSESPPRAVSPVPSLNPGDALPPGISLSRPSVEGIRASPPRVHSTAPSPKRVAFAPNGSPWPTGPAYIDGLPHLKSHGRSVVTVDNSQGRVDFFVRLLAIEGGKTSAVRYFYVPASGSFSLRDIDPGEYRLDYQNLDSGRHSRSRAFKLDEQETRYGSTHTNITLALN